MKLTIFDLDNTLLSGDSDYLWGQFLIEQGLVDKQYYERENLRFYKEYEAGTLDIYEFLQFSLKPLADNDIHFLTELRNKFIIEKIKPIIPQASHDLIQKHREAGGYLLIITATNRFVTEPIANELKVDELIATDPEFTNGRFTGNVTGVPCFRDGKVIRLKHWLTENGQNLSESWFYSDSHNDLPLLELVQNPIAVNPDDTLAQHAEMKGWPIISLRNK